MDLRIFGKHSFERFFVSTCFLTIRNLAQIIVHISRRALFTKNTRYIESFYFWTFGKVSTEFKNKYLWIKMHQKFTKINPSTDYRKIQTENESIGHVLFLLLRNWWIRFQKGCAEYGSRKKFLAFKLPLILQPKLSVLHRNVSNKKVIKSSTNFRKWLCNQFSCTNFQIICTICILFVRKAVPRLKINI